MIFTSLFGGYITGTVIAAGVRLAVALVLGI